MASLWKRLFWLYAMFPHSNVNVTRNVYARFSPDYLARAASALEFDDLGPMRRKQQK